MGVEHAAAWEGDYRESFTVTALVSLTSAQPCWVSPPRSGTNDQWDFLRVITWLLEEGALRQGDFLILDNARVHHAVDSRPHIQALLGLHGVQLRFLPAYSPELNPCELVFAEVKHKLRNAPRVLTDFWAEILRQFAHVTTAQVDAFYKHCIITPLGLE